MIKFLITFIMLGIVMMSREEANLVFIPASLILFVP